MGILKYPTGDWKTDITSKALYTAVVSTGMAWEWYSDLPLSWEACEKVLKEKEKESE